MWGYVSLLAIIQMRAGVYLISVSIVFRQYSEGGLFITVVSHAAYLSVFSGTDSGCSRSSVSDGLPMVNFLDSEIGAKNKCH